MGGGEEAKFHRHLARIVMHHRYFCGVGTLRLCVDHITFFHLLQYFPLVLNSLVDEPQFVILTCIEYFRIFP